MPKSLDLIVLATGDLAIPVLEAVLEAGHRIVRVIAHRPAEGSDDGFAPEERASAELETWAAGRGVELSRRTRPGSDPVRRELEEHKPDLGLVVAYGRSFPASLLEVPKRGWLKTHFSALPKFRGLQPIRATLWSGESQAGVTVIQIDEEPDAGPIVEQERLPIDSDETFGELAPRVAALAAELTPTAIARLARSKNPKVRKQNEKSASKAPRFSRRHRLAPWWLAAGDVANRLRALSPEPGMTTLVKGERVRILKGAAAEHVQSPMGEAGSFIGLRSGRIAVLCGDGKAFAIEQVLREDGSATSAGRLARDRGLKAGDVLV